VARATGSSADGSGVKVLVLDEIHKIPGWSETVKRLWDEDTAAGREMLVLLLGSAPLSIERGLSESLAGRFELIRMPHWGYAEMRSAFGLDFEQFLYYGSYPGAANLIGDELRWRAYIVDSLIETTISRDVLLLESVRKPALLRRLFSLGCEYSGQILSYQKMLGQLHDAGNTTTLAHYLDLLSRSGMLTGLQKYSGKAVRRRASSPKLQVLNTALMTAQLGLSLDEFRSDRQRWGRLVESAIGAHLWNATVGSPEMVFYWREGGNEVDFVWVSGDEIVGIEVKSGTPGRANRGLQLFADRFGPVRTLSIGGDGLDLEEFLEAPPHDVFGT
jgi:predicted AAA+ superfamily ATPase